MYPYPIPPPSSAVIIQSPTSFVGSYRRLRKMTRRWPALTWPLFVLTLIMAWSLVVCWYCIFGLLLVPWRLLRRGGRKRKLEARRHDELIAAAMSRTVPAQPYMIPEGVAWTSPVDGATTNSTPIIFAERDLFGQADNPPRNPIDVGREEWP